MAELTISNEEQIIFSLRSLYKKYGYSPYKMTKFEEYDLYVRNKDYLISDNIITFNDTNGKLMALKPDVTLSIIKNHSDNEGLCKVFYNENVYRVTKGSSSFKEIMQVGLECIGDIDGYCLTEVLSLAAESLKTISDKCILSVSSLDIISDVLDSENLSENDKRKIIKLMGEKNLHELSAFCISAEISEKTASILCELTSLYGKADVVLPKLKELLPRCEKVADFEKIIDVIDNSLKNIIEIDFSIIGDSKYYNGITFKGFVSGISGSVLSGGQYDRLMERMRQKSKAVGFAIYLDMLEQLNCAGSDYDVDVVLLYDGGSDTGKLNASVKKLTDMGTSVLAVKTIPEKIRYKALMKFDGREVKLCE